MRVDESRRDEGPGCVDLQSARCARKLAGRELLRQLVFGPGEGDALPVDRDGAVLDQSETPIPGLFAAGSTVGGLDGGPNAGYVGGLIKATIALRAAEAIAAAYPSSAGRAI